MNEQTSNTLAVYMRKPEIIQRFTEILGDSGKAYIQSVLIAATASPDLMKCTNASIFRASLRAASLGLSCDPSLKQAWLVPYNKNVGTRENPQWVKEAQFQPHYKGLYTLAMRTGKYWQINVSPVYEGQRVFENSLTGLHVVQENNGLMVEPAAKNAAYVDVTVRRKGTLKIIGWIGYFKTKKGFEKSVWMSSVEIEDHAKKYVKDFDRNPNWSDAEKRQVMEMKTVLRQLLSWADMSGNENSQLIDALASDQPSDDVVEGQSEPVSEPIAEVMTIEQARQVIVPVGKGEKFISELAADSLNVIWLNVDGTFTGIQKMAAKLVLREDFNLDVPEAPKKTQEDMLKEMGFS